MADKEQIDKLTKRLYHRRQFIHNNYTKGSKRGYYGDLEVDGSSSSSDCEEYDDESIAILSARDSTKSQYNFYSNIRPKRSCNNRKRQRLKTTSHHPDIDVSLVAILSSKEADQFNHHYHPYHGRSILSKSSSSSSDCSGTSSDNTQEIITSCEHTKKKARPLAVVDYGSIHLNMDGSLLDSIYNIGDSNHHGGSSSRSRSTDLLIGGRIFKGVSATDDDKASLNKGIEDSTIRTDRPISVITGSALHQRTNEVSAIIASLKCNTDKKEKTCTNEMEERAAYIMSTTRTTLEDAISFSPFARVLICAQHPFTVVHVNAAYTSLVQQGLAKSFRVGQTFDSVEGRGGECLKEEEALTRIVSQLKTGWVQDTQQDRITIFPVISANDMCSQIISSYRSNLRQLQAVDNPETNMLPSSHTKPIFKDDGGVSKCSCSEYVSHYLLQIKPSNDR